MNILFLCTGNVFRSLSAEKLAQQIAPNLHIRSAGTHDGNVPFQRTTSILREHGIDITDHIGHKASQEELEWADKIVCFDETHIAFLTQRGFQGTLFNKLAGIGEIPLYDENNTPGAQDSQEALNQFIEKTIAYIEKKLPAVLGSITEGNP